MNKPETSLNIALACDWLTETGGAEQVIKVLHDLFPDAPIYTSQYRHKVDDFYGSFLDVRTGYLNLLPSHLRRFIAPLRQSYFKHLNLDNYDLVISVTGCDAKYIKGKNHICYCHIPTQYYWGKYEDYLKNPGFGPLNVFARFSLKMLTPRLRKNDLAAAKCPTKYLTISSYSKKQIKRYYKRESQILPPPVAVRYFSQPVENDIIKAGKCQIEKSSNKYNKNEKKQMPKTEQKSYTLSTIVEKSPESVRFLWNNRGKYYLNYSRQVNWKNLDTLITATVELGLPLVLVGNGPEHENLVKLAKKLEKERREKELFSNSPRPNNSPRDLVLFLPTLPREDLKNLLKYARAFVFPSEEPFGIAPVEALASGCPVVALKAGGALDYIKSGKNGLFYAKNTTGSLKYALKHFEKHPIKDKRKIKPSAKRFSEENFIKGIRNTIKGISA